MSSVTLTSTLRTLLDSLFWVDQSTPARPHYNRIFSQVAPVLLGLAKGESIPPEKLMESSLLNLSSFQRAVAKESKRRRVILGENPEMAAVVPDPEPPKKTPKKTPKKKKECPRGTLEEAYIFAQKAAERAFQKYSPLKRIMEEGDIANGYFSHYLEKGFHEKFKPEKGIPISAWIGLGMRNWCCDLLRKASFQFKQDGVSVYREISGDQPLADGKTLLQHMGAYEDDPLSSLLVEDILGEITEPSLAETVASSPLTGETPLSLGALLQHRSEGYTYKALGEMFLIPPGKAKKLIETAREELLLTL